jgi:hypothetical protein
VNIVLAVANHHGRAFTFGVNRFKSNANYFRLAVFGKRSLHIVTGNTIEIFSEVEVFKNLFCVFFHLVCCDCQDFAVVFQFLQHFKNTGIDNILKFACFAEILTKLCNCFFGICFRKAVVVRKDIA